MSSFAHAWPHVPGMLTAAPALMPTSITPFAPIVFHYRQNLPRRGHDSDISGERIFPRSSLSFAKTCDSARSFLRGQSARGPALSCCFRDSRPPLLFRISFISIADADARLDAPARHARHLRAPRLCLIPRCCRHICHQEPTPRAPRPRCPSSHSRWHAFRHYAAAIDAAFMLQPQSAGEVPRR